MSSVQCWTDHHRSASGLMLRIDEHRWMKAGIEYVDGMSRVSCVVTTSFSDWSTQNWSSPSLHIRAHRINGNDVVVEFRGSETEPWTMIRIAHFHDRDGSTITDKTPVQAGAYIACPAKTADKFYTDFHKVRISQGGREFHHSAE